MPTPKDTPTAEEVAAAQAAAKTPPVAAAPPVAVNAGPKPVRVRAIQRGYFGGRIREIGDVFDIAADTDLGGWMDPVDAEDAKRLSPVLKAKRVHNPVKALVTADPTPVYKRR